MYVLSAGTMVFVAGGLIPARFLTLISHLTIVIVILWSRVSYDISLHYTHQLHMPLECPVLFHNYTIYQQTSVLHLNIHSSFTNKSEFL